MSGKHIAAIVWALIAFVLAPAPARAQETEDSPAPPGPAAGKPTPRPPAPEGSVVAGSFPRSFVIPGTDVSLRIGGLVTGSVLWYLKGANTGGALNNTGGSSENYTEGQGSNGNLASIPLNGVPAPGAVGFAHSRSSTWDFSGKTSRFFLDARGPSPYGEVKGYVELDFGAVNPFTDLNNNRSSVNGYIARFRQGYAALGGLLVLQKLRDFSRLKKHSSITLGITPLFSTDEPPSIGALACIGAAFSVQGLTIEFNGAHDSRVTCRAL
jgi:hypothetical protein